MERLPAQSALWRGFALFVLVLLVLMSATGFAVSTGWEAARAIYWLCAPLGLIGYAFGFRVLSVTFWRVYAVIFALEISIRTAPFAWLLPSRVLDQVDGSRLGSFTILFGTVCIALTCLALFRYAEILGGGKTEMGMPRQIPTPAWLKKRRPPVQLAKTRAKPSLASEPSLAPAFVAWMGIIFVCPVALLAWFLLLPNTIELLDRILHYPVAPRRPLTIMLFTQVALLTLPTLTFVSWRRARHGRERQHRTSKTIALGGATLGVGLFAYLWIALQVAAFPD